MNNMYMALNTPVRSREFELMLGPSRLEWFISLVVVAFLTFIIAKLFFDSKKSKAEPPKVNYNSANIPRKANGSCGTVKTFDVPDKTAAMLMAIVADRLQVPLNELKFISIKEVETEEKTDEI